MKISLTKDLERYIEGEVESGRYRSSEEMIRTALRLMMEYEVELSELRAGIDEAREQFRRGEGIAGSQMTVERIRAGALQRFGSARRNPNEAPFA